jgi:DNA repair protein RadA
MRTSNGRRTVLLRTSNDRHDCSSSALVSKDTGQETNPMTTAAEYHRYRRNTIERISTGCIELDNLLRGGMETKAVTQFYGDSGSGKTQICHSLATIVSQDKSEGGVDSKCIYIDTEGSFRPERVSEIAKARGFDPDLALKNIFLYQPLNSEMQELVVERFVPKVLASTDKRTKLIIVDSPITHYKTEYTGLSERPSKLQKLFRFMSSLQRIGQSYGAAIVVTNHASTIPDSNFVADIDIKKPAGGNSIRYASTYVLYLKNSSGYSVRAIPVKCPFEPRGFESFTINEMGVASRFTD